MTKTVLIRSLRSKKSDESELFRNIFFDENDPWNSLFVDLY